MTELNQQELAELVGAGKIPAGSIPAAWWISTDESQLAAYDRWVGDYRTHVERVDTFAATLGLTSKDAMLTSWGDRSVLTGFAAPHRMKLWREHPDHIPTPAGWRIDAKTDRLVPKRKTKADRDSQANKDFAALKVVPDIHAYVSGLPSDICLDDRDFGGTMYRMQYRRGENCVMAFSGGDPDRSPDKRANSEIDTALWQRQKLSALLALRETLEVVSG